MPQYADSVTFNNVAIVKRRAYIFHITLAAQQRLTIATLSLKVTESAYRFVLATSHTYIDNLKCTQLSGIHILTIYPSRGRRRRSNCYFHHTLNDIVTTLPRRLIVLNVSTNVVY